ncbi:hypothetical protein AX16_000784 [Volvariella volvacea WC 439]|nr:hypothetical protein AX16_000784 [Volvariella volvacea WC 439]
MRSFTLLYTLALVAVTTLASPLSHDHPDLSHVQADDIRVPSSVASLANKYTERNIIDDVKHAVNGHVHGNRGVEVPGVHTHDDDHDHDHDHGHHIHTGDVTIGPKVSIVDGHQNQKRRDGGSHTVPIRLGPQITHPTKRHWGNFANLHVEGVNVEHEVDVNDGVQTQKRDVDALLAAIRHKQHHRDVQVEGDTVSTQVEGSIPGVIQGVSDRIEPIVQQLVAATKVQVQAEVAGPLLGQLQLVLSEATRAVKQLQANPDKALLYYTDRFVPVRETSLLLTNVFQMVVVDMFALMNSVVADQKDQVIPLVQQVGDATTEFVSAVYEVGTEMRAVTTPLLSNFKQTLMTLSLGNVVEGLGL